MISRTKRVLIACVPSLLLLATLEVLAHVAVSLRPAIETLPLAPGVPSLFVPHPELFWTLRPGLDLHYAGVHVATNALGLRSAEIEKKRPDELRILSLGESTTFGEGVEANETYTEQLMVLLAADVGDRSVTAINAGVPAYSSFQGLRFLETVGLHLQPDLVIVYFELNDYLPSSLRDAGETEIGLVRTDRELYERRSSRWSRQLSAHSALYRVLSLWSARRQMRAFAASEFRNPLLTIGLPDIGLLPRLASRDSELDLRPGGREIVLARRVSDAERRLHFTERARLTSQHGVELLVVHPSYRHSRPHDCMLTELAGELELPVLDAQPILHPAGAEAGTMFRDFWHPNPEGHARLAAALAHSIRDLGLDRR